tara:strand:+ start:1997 stop:2221 length:225 start_codon:yes stop_codon:yes gene_type:complete
MASSDEYYQEWVDEVRELYGLLEDALIAMNNATRSKGMRHVSKDDIDEMGSVILQIEDILSAVDDLEHNDPEPV